VMVCSFLNHNSYLYSLLLPWRFNVVVLASHLLALGSSVVFELVPKERFILGALLALMGLVVQIFIITR